MNMQLRQCFSRAKPFRLKKIQILSGIFWIPKKPKVFEKSQKFKIWLQKSQIGNPGAKRDPTPHWENAEKFIEDLKGA